MSDVKTRTVRRPPTRPISTPGRRTRRPGCANSGRTASTGRTSPRRSKAWGGSQRREIRSRLIVLLTHLSEMGLPARRTQQSLAGLDCLGSRTEIAKNWRRVRACGAIRARARAISIPIARLKAAGQTELALASFPRDLPLHHRAGARPRFLAGRAEDVIRATKVFPSGRMVACRDRRGRARLRPPPSPPASDAGGRRPRFPPRSARGDRDPRRRRPPPRGRAHRGGEGLGRAAGRGRGGGRRPSRPPRLASRQPPPPGRRSRPTGSSSARITSSRRCSRSLGATVDPRRGALRSRRRRLWPGGIIITTTMTHGHDHHHSHDHA